MVKGLLTALIVMMGYLFFSNFVHATQEARDLTREKKLFRNYSGEGSSSISSLCIEEHVFVLVSSNLSNQSTIIQVYEEKEGKIVPRRCNANIP
jgi:hypothetical protein